MALTAPDYLQGTEASGIQLARKHSADQSGSPLREVDMLLIIIIILLILWAPGYYGYGRSRWGMGYGGDIVTLLLIIVLLWAIFGGRM
jgi:hypothetical protein